MDQETTNNIENDLNNLTSEGEVSELIAQNISGSVKWFNRVKGFGFVTRDDTKEDILIHHSGIKSDDIRGNLKQQQSRRRFNLYEKEKVVFDIFRNGKLLTAKNLVGKNGYLIIDQVSFKRGIPPINCQIINDNRLSGKVKWFNVKTRFGYVQCDYNNEDVYVNSVSIVRNNPGKYKASLADGETVEFDILKRPTGKLEAVNVTGPNGEAVLGSEYSPDKVDRSKLNVIEQGVLGKVKWFNLKSGFGYVTRNDNGQDIYAHFTSVAKKNPNHRLRSLGDGELVRFNIVDTAKGQEAIEITGPDGEPVIGSEYAIPSNRRREPPITESQRGRVPRNGRAESRRAPPPQQNYDDQQIESPRRRRPIPRRSESGGGRLNDDGMRRPINRRRGPPMNPRNNYAPNPYNNNNLYNIDEPLYYTFKPKNNTPYDNDGPRRIPFDRYMNMVNKPSNPPRNSEQRRGPPRNQGLNKSNPNNANLEMLAERVGGFCKWFNYLRGFGYITRYDNHQDVYVNRSAIQRVKQNGVMASLDENEPVEFDVCQDPMNNILAINVTGPNNSLLKGSRYANLTKQEQQENEERSEVQTKIYRRKPRVGN